MAEGGAAGPTGLDTRFDYLQERVCSCLKVRDEQFQKLLQGETRYVALKKGDVEHKGWMSLG